MKNALALILAFGLIASTGLAQDTKPAPKPEVAPAATPAKQEAAAKKVDPAVAKWTGLLAQHATHANEKIRGSAFRGLIAVGEEAVPHLEKLAKSKDAKVKQAAERALRQVKNEIQRKRASDPKLLAADLAKEYKLDEKKTAKLQSVLADYSSRMKEMMEAMRSGDLDRREMMTEMRESGEDFREDLSSVLPEDAVQDVVRRVQRSMMGGRGGRGGRGGGNRGGRGGRGGQGGGRGGQDF